MMSERTIRELKKKVDAKSRIAIRFRLYNLSERLIGLSARINYYYHLCYRDDLIEQNSKELINNLNINENKNVISNNTVFFYDLYGWANRGLAYTYIESMSKSFKVFYVFDRPNGRIEKDLLDLLSRRNISIIDLSKITNIKKKLDFIRHVSSGILPEKILIHGTPSSLAPFFLKKTYERSLISMINITDHAFWLGASIVDHVIEFRNYGAFISSEERKIKPDCIFKIPLFPHLPFKSQTLQNTVELDPKKINIFTGGDLAKIVSKDRFFLNLLVRIVNKFPDVTIIIAGGGNPRDLIKFIEFNNVSKNINYIGFRTDIPEIMPRIDIYLSTFPIGGGLMNAYALNFKKPIISFVDPELPHTYIENNFDIPEKLSFSCIDDFFLELSNLISDKSYRKDQGCHLAKYLITKDVFDNRLEGYLNNDLEPIVEMKHFYYSCEKSMSKIIEAENAGMGKFEKIFFKELGIYSFLLPWYALNFVAKIVRKR